VSEPLPHERVRIDCFLVADAAQEVGGKLYVLGGGWNVLSASSPGTPAPAIALAVRVVVPWLETNRPLKFDFRLIDPDGDDALEGAVEAELNVGRPPHLPPGTEQAAPFAITFNNMVFAKPGVYAFTAQLDGAELARTRFNVFFRSSGA
jgi:hypothetical protein